MTTSLSIPRGASDSYTFTIKLNGTAIDISTFKIGFYVARYPGAVPFITKLNTAEGGGDSQIEHLTQSGDTLGMVKVKLGPADSDYEPGSYSYDLWIDDGTDRIQAEGPSEFTITETVGAID